MKKPKTVKSWLKMLLIIADTSTIELKGSSKLTSEERKRIINNIGDLQNDLGDNLGLKPVLEKFKLKWN